MPGRAHPARAWESAGRVLGQPLGWSAALHVAAIATLFLLGGKRPAALPPVYRVDLIAAPAGPRQAGVVRPQPASPATPAQTPPPRAETRARDMPSPVPSPAPRRPSPPATPTAPSTTVPAAPAPTAGGGPTGGRGTDVVTVRTNGIEFPFPGYLSNIVRQIALRFKPDNPAAPLRADLFFLIHRDGRVSDMRVVTSSGDYGFDLEARGAVEAAATAGAFGPLPTGFTDDVLPVTFSFDPQLIR